MVRQCRSRLGPCQEGPGILRVGVRLAYIYQVVYRENRSCLQERGPQKGLQHQFPARSLRADAKGRARQGRESMALRQRARSLLVARNGIQGNP